MDVLQDLWWCAAVDCSSGYLVASSATIVDQVLLATTDYERSQIIALQYIWRGNNTTVCIAIDVLPACLRPAH